MPQPAAIFRLASRLPLLFAADTSYGMTQLGRRLCACGCKSAVRSVDRRVHRSKSLTIRGSTVRHALGGLLTFAAVNAFGGGYYALTGAEGVPREWLTGSPFRSYFVPGLVLFAGLGGTFLAAAIAVFARLRMARLAVYASAVITLIWLVVQVMVIGYVSWMQPLTAAIAIVILGLGLTLEDLNREARPATTAASTQALGRSRRR
jgi:hypothetical protein